MFVENGVLPGRPFDSSSNGNPKKSWVDIRTRQGRFAFTVSDEQGDGLLESTASFFQWRETTGIEEECNRLLCGKS